MSTAEWMKYSFQEHAQAWQAWEHYMKLWLDAQRRALSMMASMMPPPPKP